MSVKDTDLIEWRCHDEVQGVFNYYIGMEYLLGAYGRNIH
jgi:hypothetical protein